MRVSKFGGKLGAQIDAIDLRQASDADLSQILGILLARRFVVIRDQTLDNDDYVTFGRRWGEPVLLIARRSRLESHPEMIVQSNRESTPQYVRNNANNWHCDSSYEEVPATFTMLYGVEAPHEGGITMFADMVGAFESLPKREQQDLEALTALHKTAGATPMPDEHISDRSKIPPEIAATITELAAVTHPLVVGHPLSGRKALYGLGGSIYGIEGMEQAEATDRILQLRRYATQERFVGGHKLLPGEVLIWDNFSAMHRATPTEYSDESGRRRLNYRISVKGVPAFARESSRHGRERTQPLAR